VSSASESPAWFDGRWFDGRSAAPQLVSFTFGRGMLLIEHERDGAREQHRLAGLKIAERCDTHRACSTCQAAASWRLKRRRRWPPRSPQPGIANRGSCAGRVRRR